MFGKTLQQNWDDFALLFLEKLKFLQLEELITLKLNVLNEDV